MDIKMRGEGKGGEVEGRIWWPLYLLCARERGVVCRTFNIPHLQLQDSKGLVSSLQRSVDAPALVGVSCFGAFYGGPFFVFCYMAVILGMFFVWGVLMRSSLELVEILS